MRTSPAASPTACAAKIDKAAVKTPAIFRLLQKKGGIAEHDMFNTFNMGVGMAVIVSPETADAALCRSEGRGDRRLCLRRDRCRRRKSCFVLSETAPGTHCPAFPRYPDVYCSGALKGIGASAAKEKS